MARNWSTSQATVRQYMHHMLLAAVFVLTQVMVGYHHVSDEHIDDHDGYAVECDICTIAATISGPDDPALVPEIPPTAGGELSTQDCNPASGAVARPGGPRAPPQTL